MLEVVVFFELFVELSTSVIDVDYLLWMITGLTFTNLNAFICFGVVWAIVLLSSRMECRM